jgi:hypothetical protein
MGTATSIVLADAQATPVSHTFVPLGRDANDVYWFEDQSATNTAGYWRISVESKLGVPPVPGKPTTATSRVRVGLHEPVLANITNSTVSGVMPAPTVAYTPRSFTEYVLPDAGSLLDRKNLRKMTYNLNNDANIIAVVENRAYLT